MISIDEAFVDSAAPNADAAKNGRGLVIKGKITKTCRDADETIIFGECQGSGKEPYCCSCDFARDDQPTYRCTCPSRQFPCKHCVGLMFAWVQKKASFTAADVPADLAEKRGVLAAKREKKKEVADQPKQVNKSALSKKLKQQLVGIDLLEKLTLDLVKLGIGNTTAKTAREIEENAKQLGNAYLPGAQAALHRYTSLFADETGAFSAEAPASVREASFSEALDQLARLHALVKQGRSYLQTRLDDAELKPETGSAIAAWLGHAWQLAELKAEGLVEEGVELLQLAFNSYDDVARQEYIDSGIWMNLGSGRCVQTQSFRPYRAAKYVKSDDSFFQVAVVPQLCIYPGDVNPRVRWDGMTSRPVTAADWKRVAHHARSEFAPVVKEVKNNLKSALAEKHPIYALRFSRIGTIDGSIVVEDMKGDRLVLTDLGMTEEPPSCHLIRLLPKSALSDQTMVARFRQDIDKRQLQIKPLAIATDSQLIRLTF